MTTENHYFISIAFCHNSLKILYIGPSFYLRTFYRFVSVLSHWDRFSQMQKKWAELILDVMRCYHAWLVVIHVHAAAVIQYDFIPPTNVHPKHMNAGAALEMLAITTTAAGQRLALTPLFHPYQSMRAYRNTIYFMYKHNHLETLTRCCFNVSPGDSSL